MESTCRYEVHDKLSHGVCHKEVSFLVVNKIDRELILGYEFLA